MEVQARAAARTALLAVAGCLAGVLVVWAALIGPQQVFEGPGPIVSSLTTTPTSEPPLQDDFREDAEGIVRSADPPWWLKGVVWSFEVAVLAGLALVLLLVVRAARDAWRRRRPRASEARLDVELEALAAPERARAAIARGASEQDDALSTGTPRNGIVAVWHALETQAAAGGLPREASQTPAEFVLRLLDLAQADPHAVTSLAELYREARFSDHPMSEADRERASALLGVIRTGREVGR